MKIGCCIDISRYDELVACGYESIALAAKDVADWDEETLAAAEKKLTRFNRIAEEACKQSGRGRLVKVTPPVSYREAMRQMAEVETAFLCYENEDGLTLSGFLPREVPCEIAFLVGPEGGLSTDEVAMAKEAGIVSVSLGKRILRTETAAPFVLAILAGKYEL